MHKKQNFSQKIWNKVIEILGHLPLYTESEKELNTGVVAKYDNVVRPWNVRQGHEMYVKVIK